MTENTAPETAGVEVKPDDHYAARRNRAPVVEAKPEPAAEVETPKTEDMKPAETASAESAETKTEVAADPGETETKTEPQDEDAEAAKRRKRRTLEEENYRLRQKNRELRDALDTRPANGDGRTQEPAKPEAAKRPQQADFQDYDAYIEAVADWKADQKIQDFQTRQIRQQSEGQLRNEAQQKAQRFAESAEKVRGKYEDFDEVAFSEETTITPAMAAIVIESDEPAELAYYLGTHRDEARRISQMSPAKAAMELGRIEDRMKAGTPKTVTVPPKRETQAPPPPKVVTGGSAKPSTRLEELKSDDYYSQRKANIKAGVR